MISPIFPPQNKFKLKGIPHDFSCLKTAIHTPNLHIVPPCKLAIDMTKSSEFRLRFFCKSFIMNNLATFQSKHQGLVCLFFEFCRGFGLQNSRLLMPEICPNFRKISMLKMTLLYGSEMEKSWQKCAHQSSILLFPPCFCVLDLERDLI